VLLSLNGGAPQVPIETRCASRIFAGTHPN
jgi:hypothetical protein